MDNNSFEIVEKWKFIIEFLNLREYQINKVWSQHKDVRLDKYPYKYTIIKNGKMVDDFYNIDELYGYVKGMEAFVTGKWLELEDK